MSETLPSIKTISKFDISKITSSQVIIDLKAIIKELIENSIDAHADKIDIIFHNYGVNSIQIQDNGNGINVTDFETICLRNHTSKIENFEDLDQLTTLGFRGEALNSICSLSNKLTITTTKEDLYPKCHVLNYDNMGQLVDQRIKVGGLNYKLGTSIMIEQLFKNLPVRLKNFVKNSKKEFSKAINFVINYLIIYPQIKFTIYNVLNNHKKLILATKGGDNTTIIDNLISIYGNNNNKNLLSLDLEITEDIKLVGYISSYSFGLGRSAPDRQFLYLNKRPIVFKKLYKLINEIYKSYNHVQYPIYIIDIVINPNLVDINLLPDKTNVLIKDETTILQTIETKLSEFFEVQDTMIIPKNENYQVKNSEIEIVEKTDNKNIAVHDDIDTSYKTKINATRLEGPSEDKDDLNGNDKQEKTGDQDEQEQENDDEQQEPEVDNDVINLSEPVRKTDKDSDNKKVSEIDNNENVANQISTVNQPSNLQGVLSTNEQNEMNENIKITTFEPILESAEPLTIENKHVILDEPVVLESSQENNNNSIFSSHDIKSSPQNTCTADTLEMNKLFCHQEHDEEEDKCDHQDNHGKNFYPVKHKLDDSEEENMTVISIGDETFQQYDERRPSKRLKRDMLRNMYNKKIVNSSQDILSSINKNLQSPQNQSESIVIKKEPVEVKSNSVEDLQTNQQQQYEEVESYQINKQDFLKMKLIGQFNLGFIIVDFDDNNNLFIIDQHASDEKYNFEKLMASFKINYQLLIKPIKLELSVIDQMLVIDNQEIFHNNGFKLKINSTPVDNEILLLTLPIYQNITFNLDDFNELLNLVSQQQDQVNPNLKCSKIKKILAMKACRSSIMIGTFLSKSKMREIISNLSTLDKPWNCPHGRPTMRHLIDIKNWQPTSSASRTLLNGFPLTSVDYEL